jgi:hypothetical protein
MREFRAALAAVKPAARAGIGALLALNAAGAGLDAAAPAPPLGSQ